MLVQVLSRFPKWQVDNFKAMAKKNELASADIIRLATYFFVLKYNGKYDKETVDRLEFEARKKINLG